MSNFISGTQQSLAAYLNVTVNFSSILEAVTEYWRESSDNWFTKSSDFDSDFYKRFSNAYESAASGDFDSSAWTSAPSALGLIILLDQFPRNSFRGNIKMYFTDSKAREIASHALVVRFDQKIEPALRVFFYLPFAHSENIKDQDKSVELNGLLGESFLKHAEGHRDIIRRFGRFPHRNSILGRINRPDETLFLASGGFAG